MKVKNNSLILEDPKGNEYKTKKKYCFVINPDKTIYPDVESKIQTATKENKVEREIKKLK